MKQGKNIYGLSEGVFKACKFLGLKFPPKVSRKIVLSKKHLPSDYFGDDFELDETMRKNLCSKLKWSRQRLAKNYEVFTQKYLSQKCFKHIKTDLNVYFCDWLLFASRITRATFKNYFYFAFYDKSFEQRSTFFTHRHYWMRQVLCNDRHLRPLLRNKAKADKFFSDFIHRDWLDMHECTFEEFTSFAEKHPRFFFKPTHGDSGKGAHVIQVKPKQNPNKIFKSLLKQRGLLEELIVQHKDLASFCPDTTNTLRIATLLDAQNVVHVLTASGRFGRTGTVTDNFTGGGYSVIVNPKTGVITSDGMNNAHEFFPKHPDTGKKFKGFQYPCWEKVLATVKEMAESIPQIRHIGWDITINDKEEVVLVEANDNADVNIQQAPDDKGRLYLYKPLLAEMHNYKMEQMRLSGFGQNNLRDFDSAYENNPTPSIRNSTLKSALNKLIPDCKSLMDLGCRQGKLAKKFCPKDVKYFPADFKKHDAEVIICDFNKDFPDLKVDTCLCAFTAEYVERLPQFLANICNAAQKQILMWCCPVDKDSRLKYRWENPFLTDFTEDFLVKTLSQNNFELHAQYPAKKSGNILYDFRKTSLT